MLRVLSSVAALLVGAALTGCGDSSGPRADAHVSMQDECDPASFNSALGAGTCVRQGTVTFAQFNSELNSTHSVAAWQFLPATLTIHVGQSIIAMNNGGETHTFTEVDQFGGGIVTQLNQASGNPNEAPECAALTASDMVAAGTSFTTTPAEADEIGTEHYQCCIHPWMRADVTVVP